MMSLSKHIIRGAVVDGTVFCSPNGGVTVEDPQATQTKESLDALEQFWALRGLEEGKKKGFDEGIVEGEKEGFRKGRLEGLALGKEEGHTAGYTAGLAEGRQQVLTELETLFSSLNALIEKIGVERQSLLTHAHAQITQLTIAIAQQLFPKKLLEGDQMATMIAHLIEMAKPLTRDCSLDVLVSLEDYELVLKHEVAGASQVRFISDKSLERGHVRLESPLGLINFDLKRLLEDLEVRLLEVADSSPPLVDEASENSEMASEQVASEQVNSEQVNSEQVNSEQVDSEEVTASSSDSKEEGKA